MFTGIIQAIGSISDKQLIDGAGSFTFSTECEFLKKVELGASIAVNGVCLTVSTLTDNTFTADLSAETLDCTTFARLTVGSSVHFEKALTLAQGVNGHLVSGHIDVVGDVVSNTVCGDNNTLSINIAKSQQCYLAQKGSIAIDGVSLTINAINDSIVDVNIVPYSLKKTHLGALKKGHTVNVEVDMIAKYVANFLANKE